MGNVVCKGFLVEDTGAHQRTLLPGCKGASNGWDGGKVLADAGALIFSLKLLLKDNKWLIATALRAGNLYIKG